MEREPRRLPTSFRLTTGYAPRNSRADLAATNVRVLALIGADDGAFKAEMMAPALSAFPNVRGEVIPATGHFDLAASVAATDTIVAWLMER